MNTNNILDCNEEKINKIQVSDPEDEEEEFEFEEKVRLETSYIEIYKMIDESVKSIININDESKDEKEMDGRIISAIKEKDYIKLVVKEMKKYKNRIKIEIPEDRYWYDIKINDIPINIKITSGGTDNVFNKTAIIYTLTNKEIRTNMNFNEFYENIKNIKLINKRDRIKEYHYLVFFKNSNKYLFKSILDIQKYKENPSNILQINWNNELKEKNYKVEDDKVKDKVIELIETIQNSKIKEYNNSKKFIEADIKLTLFEHTPGLEQSSEDEKNN